MMNEQVPPTDPGVAGEASRGRRRRRWVTALAVATVALIVPGYFAFHVVKVKLGWPSETRNVWQYGQIRRLWEPNLVQHFPETLRSGARGCRLYYTPGFLQGGAEFRVSMQLPPDRVRAILADARLNAKLCSDGSAPITAGSNEFKNYPLPTLRFVGEDVGLSPSGYVIIVLDGKPYHPNNWNHGFARGIAVRSADHEVVYWVENW